MAMEAGPWGADVWCYGVSWTETGYLCYLIQISLKSIKNRCFLVTILGPDSTFGQSIG